MLLSYSEFPFFTALHAAQAPSGALRKYVARHSLHHGSPLGYDMSTRWVAILTAFSPAMCLLRLGACPAHVLSGHSGGVTHVAVSGDGAFAVTCSTDGTARVWDAATWGALATLAGSEASPAVLNWVAVAPDGSFVVTAADDNLAIRSACQRGHTEVVKLLLALPRDRGVDRSIATAALH